MAHNGARNELVKELRRIGPTVDHALERLGLSVTIVGVMPGGSAWWAEPERAMVIGVFDSELRLWEAIAYCLAHYHEIEVSAADLLHAAGEMAKAGSGIFPAVQIA